MVDQCCGMAEQGCCQEEGQKCYTIYERKCRYANKPVCQMRTKEFCDTQPIKACRRVAKTERREIPMNTCRQQMEEHCFNVTARICNTKPAKHNETFSWTNQELDKLEDRDVRKCHNVNTCEITNEEVVKTRKVPKRECKDVAIPRQVCSSVPVPQPPIDVPYNDYRIEYKRQCYKINRPVCRVEPCQYNVVQENICPTCMEPSYPGQGCGTPSCATPGIIGGCGVTIGAGRQCGLGPDICGACRQQQVTTCQSSTTRCENQVQEVCQQVPYRVVVPKTRTVQPPPRWEMKCETVEETKQQCQIVYKTENYTEYVKKCNQGMKEKCVDYKVPNFGVVDKPMSESVQFDTTECTEETKVIKQCVKLPTNYVCQNRTITRTVRIHQTVCDREREARYCYRVPHSYCKNVPGQECSMEPREVCQPSCPQTSYCNSCVQFASVGGFSQCQTSSCPNFIGGGHSYTGGM